MVCLTSVTPMPLLSNIKTAQAVVMIRSTLFLCDLKTVPTTLFSLFVLSPSKYMDFFTMQKDRVFFSSAESLKGSLARLSIYFVTKQKGIKIIICKM